MCQSLYLICLSRWKVWNTVKFFVLFLFYFIVFLSGWWKYQTFSDSSSCMWKKMLHWPIFTWKRFIKPACLYVNECRYCRTLYIVLTWATQQSRLTFTGSGRSALCKSSSTRATWSENRAWTSAQCATDTPLLLRNHRYCIRYDTVDVITDTYDVFLAIQTKTLLCSLV